jgi:hypothetical protein
MPYAAYPLVSDVQQVWLATGLFTDPTQLPQSNVPWAARLASAAQWMESQTGRQFLPVTQTRIYDPPLGPKALLPLNRDLIRLTGTIVLQGTGLVINSDYYLGPSNADMDGRPWEWIEFNNYFPSPLSVYQRKSITIPGLWGYSDDGNGNPAIPDDIWDGVAQKAAALCLPEMLIAITNGLVKLDDAQYQTARGDSPITSAAAVWTGAAQVAANDKRRTTVF